MSRRNDPYADDETDKTIAQADEAAKAKLREKASTPTPDPSAPTEIDLDQLEEEQEEERAAAPPQKGERTPREERRGDRWKQHTEARTAAEKRAEDAERALQEERQRRIALEAVQQATRRDETPQENPLKRELSDVRRLQQATWVEYNQKGGEKMSQADQDAFQARAYELRDKELALVARMSLPPQQQVQQDNPERAAAIARIRMDYPDVAGHQQAAPWATARYHQLVAEGKPATFATAQVALDEARSKFRLGNGGTRPAPSPNLRQKMSGLPAGGSGAGGGGESRRVISMTPERQKIAEAWAPKGTKPKEAHKLWAQKVGSKLIEKGLA